MLINGILEIMLYLKLSPMIKCVRKYRASDIALGKSEALAEFNKNILFFEFIMKR